MVKKGLTIFITCLAIVTGIIWYNVYLPLSSKIEDVASKSLPFIFNLAGFIASNGEKLGIGTSITNMRAMASVADLLYLGNSKLEDDIHIEDLVIAGVPVTIFRPATSSDLSPPVIIHLHGGGLAIGTKLRSFRKHSILFAKRTRSVVIAVYYRLAPENIFPAQFNDGFAVVSAIMTEPTKFAIDRNRVALTGDSAGGLLSAAISLEYAKLGSSSKIAAQVLIYPWLQSIDVVCLPSYKAHREGYVLSDEGIALFASLASMGTTDMVAEYLVGNVSKYFMQTPYWKYLKIPENSNCDIPVGKSAVELPSSFVEKITDQRLSPLLAENVDGSPPTFIAIAEHDVLASEGMLFAKRLKVAGVPVIEKQYKTYHGFMHNIGLPIGNATLANRAMTDMVNFLNSVFYTNE